MNAIPSSIDKESKRWLLVLVATVAASVIFVVCSFLKILSPQPSLVAAPKPARPPVQQPAPRTEPDWNALQAAGASQPAQASLTVAAQQDPFAARYAADAKAAAAHDPVAHEKAVHHQADYLRDLISQGQLPKGFGNLTKEQVDEMEKKRVLIE
jgi:hypothetical protein